MQRNSYIRMASADEKRDSVTLRIITRSPSTDLVLCPNTVGRNGFPNAMWRIRWFDSICGVPMRLGVGQFYIAPRANS